MSPSVRRGRRITAALAAASTAVLVAGLSATSAEAAPTSLPSPKPAGEAVQLLSFNDYHGHIEEDFANPTARQRRERTRRDRRVRAGRRRGLPGDPPGPTATRDTANSLTVAAGDLIGGSTFTSGFYHDEPSVETLNAMGLDASSVGNHEFDEGVTELLRMQRGGCHPVDGCYQQDANGGDIRYPGADFKWLAANVVNEQTGRTVLPATWVKKVGKTKIGFIGMTLEGTDSLVAPSGVAGWDFQDEVEAGNRAARMLTRDKGVKAIVVLLHEGGVQTGTYNGCDGISGPIVEIAENLDTKIDALITGHTHQPYNCTINDPSGKPRKVVSAFSFGRIITEMNFVINTQDRRHRA